MTEQLAQISSSPTVLDATAPSNAWDLAKKRANEYLKLHRIADAEREHLLTQITLKLTWAGIYSEAELIQLFISTAQQELASLQACQCKKAAIQPPASDDLPDSKTDNRTKTGPRFERSSIRVAPLQTISLLFSRPRQRLQRLARHPH